jgi:peptidoglycan/xylan/chitin deacetylase (PgdA/CDA1 family)
MNWKVWSEIEAALMEHRLKPILAVVPDNRDPVLKVAAEAGDFWDRVRQWEARGWTIALHGFQHKYVAAHAGIVTLKKLTEFAGVRAGEQEEKLRRGMEIFERHGIHPQVWIAPNNSFDGATVSLLPRFGIRVICDGYFHFPFVCQQKMIWVPQQLFGFRPAPSGVWTVCYHHNNWTSSQLGEFRKSLDRYHADIWSLDDVLQAWAVRRSRSSAWLCTSPRLSQLLIRCELKLWEWWGSGRVQSLVRTKVVLNCKTR